MPLNFNTTKVFGRNLATNKSIVINRGGTRSSKTYSLAQLFILKLVTEHNKKMLITRKTFPALRVSAMKDVIDLLKEKGIYNKKWHNKSEYTFHYPPTNSTIYFISIDKEQKIRGPEWNYAWFNEANEMLYKDFKQVYMRLSSDRKDGQVNQIFLDFNPDNPDIWINTEIEQTMSTEKYELIHSTYEDNPFLTDEDVGRIEWLRENDKSFWTVYGLGKYGEITGTIINNWDTVDEFPERNQAAWMLYGLDFGFTNDPTALVDIAKAHGEIYWRESIYERGMTNQDIADRMEQVGVPKIDEQGANEIIADSAEPKSIEEIYQKNFNIMGVEKGKGSVNWGVQLINQYKHNITKDSPNIKKEFKNYKWKQDKNGNALNEPVDKFNHAIDAGRYALMSKHDRNKETKQPDLSKYYRR